MPRGSKQRTAGDYLLTFAPWVAYVSLTEAADSWRLGFAIGLTISAGTVAWRTLHTDSRFIDVGTLCYCAAMTGVSLSYPDSPLRPYNIPLSAVVVGLLSLVSVISGSPFTYRIARDKVPGWVLEDPAQHARLFQAHTTATKSWAAAQVAGGTLGAAFVGAKLAPAAITAQLIGTLVPVGITRFQHERFMHSAVPSGHPPPDPNSAADDQNGQAVRGKGPRPGNEAPFGPTDEPSLNGLENASPAGSKPGCVAPSVLTRSDKPGGRS